MAAEKKSDSSFRAGHRQRLRQKFLDGNLADYELLELALSFAVPRRDVRPAARALMQKFGTIYQILTASVDELAAVQGIGRNSAIFIKTMHRIMMLGFRGYLMKTPMFHNYSQFEDYCRLVVGGKTEEEVHVLYLDNQLCLLADDVHSVGTVNESGVYPDKIVRRAMALDARSVALVHNHPTPCTSFSDEDKKMTLDLMILLDKLNIRLYDHYVVSGSTVYSARNMHMMDSK